MYTIKVRYLEMHIAYQITLYDSVTNLLMRTFMIPKNKVALDFLDNFIGNWEKKEDKITKE